MEKSGGPDQRLNGFISHGHHVFNHTYTYFFDK